VRVTFTLFDGGRAAAARAQAAAEADAVRRQLEDLDGRIRLEVTRSEVDVGVARRALEVSAGSVRAAEESVRVARDRYHEGVVRSSDLLDAETASLRAGLERTSALVALRIALADRQRAVGSGAP
jgi:outer membrane protein TolC